MMYLYSNMLRSGVNIVSTLVLSVLSAMSVLSRWSLSLVRMLSVFVRFVFSTSCLIKRAVFRVGFVIGLLMELSHTVSLL